ncbi:unnamed protein product [Cylicostephanus goldi]|uniref:Uncharacterized protein n=1 Tax=Cylicostephanus goldi TaxID=71465 RepID=A0A3P6SPX5_CYLGO|nr:unnamed protein product [Cylicostephanus goldi]
MCFVGSGDVITGDSNGTLTLWDPNTYKAKKQAHVVHHGGVFALCISKKGTLLSAGKDRTIAEWETTDLVRRRRPVELPDDAGTPRVLLNPVGDKIIVGTSRNTLYSGDFEAGFEEIVDESITCASVNPSSSLLALGFATGAWKVMDLSSIEMVFEQKGSSQAVTAIQFAPSGDLLFVATKVSFSKYFMKLLTNSAYL